MYYFYNCSKIDVLILCINPIPTRKSFVNNSSTFNFCMKIQHFSHRELLNFNQYKCFIISKGIFRKIPTYIIFFYLNFHII